MFPVISLVAGIVKLSSNIERDLMKLYLTVKPGTNLDTDLMTLKTMVRTLVDNNIIPSEIAAPLYHFFDITNQAVHGNLNLKPEDLRLTILTGTDILRILDATCERYFGIPKK